MIYRKPTCTCIADDCEFEDMEGDSQIRCTARTTTFSVDLESETKTGWAIVTLPLKYCPCCGERYEEVEA